jgi:phosphatidylglycerol:prolipoprotein diacylglycerol transferase
LYPILLKIGPITIHSYGFFLATAFLIALTWIARASAKDGLNPNRIFDLGLYLAFSALAGAKILLLITEFNYFLKNPVEIISLDTLRAGGVFYGGFLAAVAVAVLYTRRWGVSFWRVADLFSPGISLGLAIGRLGCFSAGCCWGRQTDVPWAVVFTNPYSHERVGVPLMVPLHPSQLYELVGCLAIFGFSWWFLPRKKFDGQVFVLYLSLYGVLRFFLEFWRGDEDRGFLFNGIFSTSQFISLILVGLAFILYFALRNRPKQDKGTIQR